jgi:sugar phosphate permease
MPPAYAPSPAMRQMQRTALVMLVVSGTINYLDRSALAIANPEIRKELGLTATQMGVLLSAFLVSYAFAQLPTGLLVDRVGPRKLLGLGLAVWSLAQTLAGFVGSLSQLWWARLFLGVGEAPQFPSGARVVSNWFNVKERGFPTGVFNSASSIGPAIAPPILTVLMLTYGWRIMFITLGVVGLIMAGVWFAAYRDPEDRATAEDRAYIRDGDTDRAAAVTLPQWARLFRLRTIWGMLCGNFCVGYLAWIYFAWLPGYLEIQHHLSVAKTGIYAAIPPVLGILGSLIGGYLSDRLAAHGVTPLNSRKIPIIGGIIGTATCTILAAYSDGLTSAMIFISAAVFFSTITSGTVWAIVSAAAPPNYVASVGSIQNFGGYLGGTCSPILTGFIVDRTGSFVMALILGAVISLAGALIYLFVVTRPISGAELEPASTRLAAKRPAG